MKQWKATLKNGISVTESSPKQLSNWNEIKDQVIKLEFDNNGQIISLPKNCEQYIQGKTASGNMATGECTIESRYIAFKIRNTIIKVRIDERTNNISIETS